MMNRLDRNCLFLEVNAAMIHTPNASLYSVFRYITIA
jgi:tRNA threonylcarbamoyladenosine modification (KEOPS) complex  Pcc1 subunit